MSYYDINTEIRYYGQIPEKVEKSAEAVLATGIASTVFGQNVFTADWHELLKTATKEPFDLRKRKEPVHERLANLGPDLNPLHAFTKIWGVLDGDTRSNGRILTQPRHIKPFQDLLQQAWRGEPKALGEIGKDVKARVDVSAKGFDIAVVDLWSLVRLLFLRDYKAGRTKICANPDCETPYFLQQRRGQKFCTHKCAVLMNVRRFRERKTRHEMQEKRGAHR